MVPTRTKSAGRPRTVLDCMALVGRPFAGPSWDAWRVFLRALAGLPLLAADLQTFTRCTGRQSPPAPAREAWVIAGRRAGKSRIAALVAVYCAVFRRYTLAAGEVGTVMVLAADRKQARVVKRYVSALLRAVPAFAALVVKDTAAAIELSNAITIEIHTSNFRSVRGYTIVCAICDEIGFWPADDSANPDVETLNALRPAMASVPEALLLCLSTGYARRGALWEAHERYFGKDATQDRDRVLVWQADTRTMNPLIAQSVIDAAIERDPDVAAAEYGGGFRADLEQVFSLDRLQPLIAPGVRERPPQPGVSYVAFTDPGGGSGKDAFALAIGHSDGETGAAVLDAIRETPPGVRYSPAAVVEEYAVLCRRYGVRRVVGDRYAAEWPREAFRSAGIEYDVSELTRSELYGELIATVHAGRVSLLDVPRLTAQLVALERRSGSHGRDVIDHSRSASAHDDLSNVLAGAAALTASMGLAPLAPMASCLRIDAGLSMGTGCYLWETSGGSFLPFGAPCEACPGHVQVLKAWQQAGAAGGDLRSFRWQRFGDNRFVLTVRERKAIQTWNTHPWI